MLEQSKWWIEHLAVAVEIAAAESLAWGPAKHSCGPANSFSVVRRGKRSSISVSAWAAGLHWDWSSRWQPTSCAPP